MAGRQSQPSRPSKPAAAKKGPVQAAVAKEVASIRRRLKASGHEADGALVALAVNLAKRLDDDGGLATAAISKELRVTLSELAAPLKSSGEDDDGASRTFADFVVHLSAPVRNTSDA
jgi:hypothetical protein